jgi:hypothetical protein
VLPALDGTVISIGPLGARAAWAKTGPALTPSATAVNASGRDSNPDLFIGVSLPVSL